MPLPSTNKTFHLDAADTDRLWKERAMSTHPADTEEVLGWDDEADATNLCMLGNTGTSPIYRAAAFNGQGCLDFDGADNLLTARTDNDGADAALSDLITASAFTMFVSFIMEGDASNAGAVYGDDALWCDSAANLGLHLKTDTGVHTLSAYNYDGSVDVASVVISQSTKYVAMVKHVGGNISLNVNDGALTSGNVASGDTSTVGWPFQIGKAGGTANYFNGKIGEMVFYNADVTGTDLTDAWTYFMAKWVNAAGGGSGAGTRRYGDVPSMGTQRVGPGGSRGGVWGRSKTGLYVPRRFAA